MKKKYALYKLCGFNLLYLFFAVFTFWGFQPSGMFLSFVRDAEIADLLPFIMNFLIMPYLIVISYCCVFMFYYFHKNALDVLPYKKADIFRAIFRMAGILLLLVMISKSVGLTRQLEYAFMLSPYYKIFSSRRYSRFYAGCPLSQRVWRERCLRCFSLHTLCAAVSPPYMHTFLPALLRE